MRTLSRLSGLLILLILLGSLPAVSSLPRTTLAQGGPAPAPPPADRPPAFPCYGGANPPLGVLCLVVPVAYADGSPADDATVTATVEGQSLTQPVEQLPDAPVDQVAAAIDVGQMGAQPGDTIAVAVETPQLRRELYIGLAPDPASRTHTAPLVALGADAGNPGQLWGTVSALDDRAPLAGATVKLFRDDIEIASSTTEPLSQDDATPVFRFDGLDDLPGGARLRLEATYAEQQQSVMITWSGQPIEVPVVIGWGCIFAGPRNGGGGGLPRNGGGGGLPVDFCLTGLITFDGQAAEDVQVSLEVPGKAPLLTATGTITGELRPMFAANIGDLVAEILETPSVEELRIIAVRGELVGTLTLPIDELPIGERWGLMVTVPLRSERMSGLGLAGGTPRPIAMGTVGGELHTYAALPAGGGMVAQLGAGGRWLRMLGSIEHPLPSPDVSALLLLGAGGDGDHILAGTRSGEVLLSADGARHWSALPLPAPVGPLAAFALADDESLLVAGRDGLARLDADDAGGWGAGSPLPAPPFQPTSLVVMADGTLVAGAAGGLYSSSDDGGSWVQHATDPVSALALARTGSRPLLIGTPTGLKRAATPAEAWEDTTLAEPVLGLAVDGGVLRATTPEGIIEAPLRDGGLEWDRVTGSDTNATARPTVGAPDLLDLAVMPDPRRSLVAATSTGVYRSGNGGLTWQPIPGWPDGVSARSVAPLGADALLAIGDDGAYRWDGHLWAPVAVSTAPLNGTIVRSRVGPGPTLVLVGSANTRGPTLYASTDGGVTWGPISVGAGRGVTAIAFYQGEREGHVALVGTDGDGIFGWSPSSPTTLGALPSLDTPGGGVARVSALYVSERDNSCITYIGTTGQNAGVSSRPCAGGWTPLEHIVAPDGRNVGAVTAIEDSGGELLAATSEGIFRKTTGADWERVFGLALRPVTIIVPPAYAADQLLVAGGPQSGAVLLSNITADLRVDARCPGPIQGGGAGACIVAVTNQGLLPTSPTVLTATLTVDSQPAVAAFDNGTHEITFAIDALTASKEVSFPLTVTVASEARPGLAELRAEVPDNGERFTANNHDEAEIYLDYRPGPDPAVILSGQTTALPGQQRILRVRVPNLGDRALMGGELRLTLPNEVAVRGSSPAAARREGDIHVWDLPRLQPGAIFELSLTYRMPASATESAPLAVSAALDGLSDDREPGNNLSGALLRVPPANPQGVVLTNWSRQAALGPIDAAKTALAEFLPLAGGVELALDADPPCPSGSGGSLACAYQAWDNAVTALADEVADRNRPARVAELAATAIGRRQLLVERITARVRNQLPAGLAEPAFLYIIGGDSVIPSYAYVDATVFGQSLYPEKLHAATLAQKDPLYSVLIGSHYPSYAFYDRIAGRGFDVGVQPGTSAQIARALEVYNQLGGRITLDRASIAGYAKDLTADIQRQVCADLQTMGMPLAQSCQAIARHVSNGSAALAAGAALQLLSDHSDQWNVGDLSSLHLAGLAPGGNNLNVLLLLGCHTGLSPRPSPYNDPSLVDVLGGQGQPVFGYTGYAYAGADDPNQMVTQFQPIYAERLYRLLTARLLNSGLRLGALRRQAIADFGTDTGGVSELRQKTLDSLTLYGPPTYRINNAGGQPMQPPALASLSDVAADAQELVLALGYTHADIASGTLYTLTSSPTGRPYQQSGVGRTTQPGLELLLPAGVSGALIDGGAYQDTPGVDPVIRRVAPMSAFGIYSEPRYTGPARDWATPLARYQDGDGNTRLVAALGQWTPLNQTQRLFTQLRLELVRPTDPMAAAPQWPGRPTVDRVEGDMAVELRHAQRIIRVEVVLYDGGAVQVFPLTRAGTLWKGQIPASGDARFLIQVVGRNGDVLFDTNDGQLYAAPGEAVPPPEFAACPAGWEPLAQYEGRLLATGPTSLEHHFTLDQPARVALVGYAQEGHPESGCPGGSKCDQGQAHESFSATVDGQLIGTYEDQGADLNAWLSAGPWETSGSLARGGHSLRLNHLREGEGPQSVTYRLSLCVQPEPPRAAP